jgi:hypothetical protein
MAGEERLRTLQKLTGDAVDALGGLDNDVRGQRPEDLGRLEEVLGYLAIVLAGTDPALVPDATHTELTRLLEQIPANPVSSAADPGSFANALLIQMAAIPAAHNREMEQDAREAASTFRRSAGQQINAVREEAVALRQELQELRSETQERQEAATEQIETETTKLQAQLATIEAAATTAKDEVEALAEKQRAAFDEEQEERTAAEERRWSETHEKLRSDADALIEQIGEMRDQAQGLVGAVSTATTANHFQDDAKRERVSYWVLLGVTVVALGLAVYLAGKAAAVEEPDLQRLIAKLGVSLALIGLGVFTGSRARDHRAREKDSSTKEMEMRAFGPFIEPLPPQEQIRERILMTRRFFAREAAHEEELTSDTEIISTAEQIAQAAQKIVRGELARGNGADPGA